MKLSNKLLTAMTLIAPVAGVTLAVTSCSTSVNPFSKLTAYSDVDFNPGNRASLAEVAKNHLNPIPIEKSFTTHTDIYNEALKYADYGKNKEWFYWEIVYFLSSDDKFNQDSFSIKIANEPSSFTKNHNGHSEQQQDIWEANSNFGMKISHNGAEAKVINKVMHDLTHSTLHFKLLTTNNEEVYNFATRTFMKWTLA